MRQAGCVAQGGAAAPCGTVLGPLTVRVQAGFWQRSMPSARASADAEPLLGWPSFSMPSPINALLVCSYQSRRERDAARCGCGTGEEKGGLRWLGCARANGAK